MDLLGGGLTFGSNIVAAQDNTWDIGASGATRPRTVYAATSFVGGSATVNPLVLSSFSRMYGAAGGSITVYNPAETGFGLFQFGGTSVNFPALQRTNASLNLVGGGGAFSSSNHFRAGGNIISSNGLIAQPLIGLTGNVLELRTTNGALAVAVDGVTGGVAIGPNGAAVTNVLSASATLDFASTLAQTDTDMPITLAGAAIGDVVSIGAPVPLPGSIFTGFASNGVVFVRLSVYGLTAKDPDSGTFRVVVTKVQ